MSRVPRGPSTAAHIHIWRRRIAGSGSLAAHTARNLLNELRFLARRPAHGVQIIQTTINDCTMLVRAEEDVGREVYCFGGFEKDETQVLARIVRETDVCFDIGANVGYYTLLLASKASKGVVHSFEPVPLNYYLIRVNTLLNKFPNVVANCCAVGNLDGELEFSITKDTAYSSLIPTGRKTILGTSRTPVTTLDHYCDEKDIRRIDIMKVDVEGAEGLVFEGASKILQEPGRRPRVMLVELYDPMLTRYATSLKAVVEMLGDYGYRPFIPFRGNLIPFAIEDSDLHYNLFFVQGSGEAEHGPGSATQGVKVKAGAGGACQ